MLRLFNAFAEKTKTIIARSLFDINYCRSSLIINNRYFNTFDEKIHWQNNLNLRSIYNNILSNSLNKLRLQKKPCCAVLCRTVTKFSLRSGKRKSVKTVLKRFYRLNWGIWIRTIAGRHKHLWKKSKDRKMRSKQHIFINSTQSWILDRMVTKFWKRPKYYVDDPYLPYHKREEYLFTQKKFKCLIKE